MRAIKFPEQNRVMQPPPGMNEDECLPLYVWSGQVPTTDTKTAPALISCWEPTEEERKVIAEGGKVWLYVMGNGMPPVHVSAERPWKDKP